MLIRTLTAVQEEAEEPEEKLWKTSLDQISEDDKWMIDAWIEDANGVLAFVSLNSLVCLFINYLNKKLSRRVFSPPLLVLLLSSSTKNCLPILAVKQ